MGNDSFLQSKWEYFDNLQKCLLICPLYFRRLVKSAAFVIGCQGDKKGKFSREKVFFSETVMAIKLKLGMHAQDIRLYISCVFCSGQIRTLVPMATYIFHRLIIGKVKLLFFSVSMEIFGFYFYRNVYYAVIYVSYGFCPSRRI